MVIGIFGGDKRMLFAARAFAEEGLSVCAAGFDQMVSLCGIRFCTTEEAASRCDVAVLPVRPVTDGCLTAPFSTQKIGIPTLADALGNKPVFSGSASQLSPYVRGALYDYAAAEDFILKNAVLTAEGAIGILLSDYEGAIRDCRILVTGYGRIGKVLSGYLHALGAQVSVAARNLRDRKTARDRGLFAEDYPQIDYGAYRVIINTVPALVLDRNALNAMREDVFIVDLASLPGGVDDRAARERDLTCIHALSLPGKTAPLTAGNIIKDTIIKLLSDSKEENGGKDKTGLCDDRLLLHLG